MYQITTDQLSQVIKEAAMKVWNEKTEIDDCRISGREYVDTSMGSFSSAGKIGELLAREGDVAPHTGRHNILIKQRVIYAAFAALISLSALTLSGCGGGGGGGGSQDQTAAVTVSSPSQTIKTNYLKVTTDDYGLIQPTFYYSTVNNSFWSIQANVAKNVGDIDTKCVLRIDIPKGDGGYPLLNKTFSIEDNQLYEKFPGTFLVFNGMLSTQNKVEQGIVSFSPNSVAAEYVSGSFDITVTDYDAGTLPPRKYNIKGIFSFKMGDYGPA